VPLFSGRWRNCHKFCHEFDGAFVWQLVVTKEIKTEKFSFERGTIALQFGEKYLRLLYPFLKNRGGRVGFRGVREQIFRTNSFPFQ